MKNTIKLLIFTFIVLLCLSEATLADNTTTKSFSFGAGSANPTSVKHSFRVPCQLDVKASIRAQRGGGSGAEDVEIVMELMGPGSSFDEVGPLESSKTGTAKILAQNFALIGNKNARGCNLPWTVRIKTKSGQAARVGIVGQIFFEYLPAIVEPKVGTGPILGFKLDHGETLTLDLGNSQGLTSGSMIIEGDWMNSLQGAPMGILPVKLKFELINPEGNVVASDTGYAKNEINPCCSGNKLKIRFSIPSCSPGQWKLRIKNLEQTEKGDATVIRPKIALTPNCL